MNTKLITALRTAAKSIEDGTFDYDWNHHNSCNCGIVACSLLGKSSSQLKRMIPNELEGKGSTWKKLVGQYCPVTGIPENELFMSLFSFGLTQKDIVELEYLKNPTVRSRVSLPKIEKRSGWRNLFRNELVDQEWDYKNKDHVAKYLRAWADIIQEQSIEDSRSEAPETSETLAEK